MSAQTVREQVRWQDLQVRSEIDIVLEIAKKEGWKDCEVFGYGDMITEPQESKGWKLIPADIYKHSIPPQAIGRLHQIINAGIRVRVVIIADDERRTEVTPAAVPVPAKPRVSLSSGRRVVPSIGSALPGSIRSVGTGVSLIGKALRGLSRVAVVIALLSVFIYALIHFWSVILLGLGVVAFLGFGSSMTFDPKLIILVDDGNGGTTWVSLFTWYD